MIIIYIVAIIVCMIVAIVETIVNIVRFVVGILLLVVSLWFRPWWSYKYSNLISSVLSFNYHWTVLTWKKYTII